MDLILKNSKPIRWKSLLILFLGICVSNCASQPKKGEETASADKAPQGRTPHIPDLSHAQVKVLWIPEKIESDRWEEGHFLYVIDKPSTWSSK